MITSIIVGALATLAVAGAPAAADPPPPPYDDVSAPQEFTPFWAAGPRPGIRDRIEWAVTPAEGRALCEHYQRWDAYNGEIVDCWVAPLSAQPVVEEPGWLIDWSEQSGFPGLG